jgi:mannose-6-phosphate isomerase-like protein (cupin superfamily)
MHTTDINAEARSNDYFREVVMTGGHLQVVVMTLQVGEDIGAEVHEHNDQLLTFVDGRVRADVAGESREVGPGDVVLVPAGTQHNFTNIADVPARLYTVYGPPDHSPDTVHKTKADAEAAEQTGSDQPPPEHD